MAKGVGSGQEAVVGDIRPGLSSGHEDERELEFERRVMPVKCSS
jgi:hypothetical protein